MNDIKIKNIRELRWEYCDVLYLEDIEFDIKKFKSDINFDFTIYKEDNVIEMFFHVRYALNLKREGGKEEEKIQILHSDIELDFLIKDLEDNFQQKEEKEQKELLALLLGITISTARGIIYSHTKGHLINKLILPIINPSKLLNKKLKNLEEIK